MVEKAKKQNGLIQRLVKIHSVAGLAIALILFALPNALAQDVTGNFLANFDGNISYYGNNDDNYVNQQYMVGQFQDSHPGGFWVIKAEEIENGSVARTDDIAAAVPGSEVTQITRMYPEFNYIQGNVRKLDTGFKYGTVYFSRHTCDSFCVNFLFVPNGNGINKISASDTMSVRISYDLQETSFNTTLIDSYSLPINFNKIDPPTLSISQAEITEGNTGDTSNPTIDFAVTVSAAQSTDFTIDYFVDYTGDNPASASDFLTAPAIETDGTHNQITFLTDTSSTETDSDTTMTNTTHKISLAVAHDGQNEGDETFTVVLSATSLSGVTITTTPSRSHTAMGTIRNDDHDTAKIEATDVLEDMASPNNKLVFTVTLSNSVPSAFRVNYSVTFGSGVDATDFVGGLPATTYHIPFTPTGGPPAMTPTTGAIEFEIMADSTNEGDETVMIVLDNVTETSTSDTSDWVKVSLVTGEDRATGKINNDDHDTVSIEATDVVEDSVSPNNKLIFTVTLSNSVPSAFRVNYTVTYGSGVDATDFVGNLPATTNHLPFTLTGGPPAMTPTTGTIEFEIMTDTISEGDENVMIVLDNVTETGVSDTSDWVKVSSVTGEDRATGTITNDDGDSPPTQAVTVSVVAERSEIKEGESVRFTFRSTSERNLNNIAFSISQQGNHIAWSSRKSVNIAAGQPALLDIATTVNTTEMTDGKIIVRILDGTGYEAHEDNGMAQVAVKNITNVQRYSVVGAVISSILTQESQDSSPPNGNSEPTVPEISIVALDTMVNEGSPVRFQVKSSQVAGNRLTVNLRIDRSSEFIGGNSTVSIAMEPGVRSVPLEMATYDDDLAGSDGRLTAMVLAGEGYRIGLMGSASTIISDEPDRQAGLNRTVLPEIVASIGTGALDATGNRVLQAFSGGAQTGLEVAGGSTIREMLETGDSMMNEDEFNWKSLLDGSSFSAALYPEDGRSSIVSIWGAGDHHELSDIENRYSETWDGDVLTGHLGFDAKVGQEILAGLTVSLTQAGVKIEGNGDAETLLDIRSTGLHPYFGFVSSDDNTSIQVTAGYGKSELEIESDWYSTSELTGNFHTFGVDGNSRIYSTEGLLYGGHSSLNLAGKSWMIQQNLHGAVGSTDPLRTVANHIRMSVEGTHAQILESGHKVSPTISIGMRRDGRDDLATYGFEIGSSVYYEASQGYTVDASGSAVLSGLNRMHEWKIQGSMDYDAGNDGLGVLASIQPEWSGTGLNQPGFLWSREILDVSDNSDSQLNGARVDSEIGYGFTVADGSWTLVPYGGVSLSEAYSSEVRIGNRFNMGNGINFEIEGSEVANSHGTVSSSIKLTGDISW